MLASASIVITLLLANSKCSTFDTIIVLNHEGWFLHCPIENSLSDSKIRIKASITSEISIGYR
jgi:hypothetical protein